MEDNAAKVVLTIIVVIALLVGYIGGDIHGTAVTATAWRSDCVNRGVGEWVVVRKDPLDPGKSTFQWKTNYVRRVRNYE